MNALILLTHPNPKSLNGAMLDAVREGLEENPRIDRIEVIDLYGEGFDPVLRFGGDVRRRDMADNPKFARYRDAITRADLIVFVYPIWWGRPPAMLLGFFDQVLASGFAYRENGGSPLPERLLRGKRAVCVSTMKGPSVYSRLWLRGAHRMLMERAILEFTGMRVARFFEFERMQSPGQRQARAIEKVRNWFERFQSRTRERTWLPAHADLN